MRNPLSLHRPFSRGILALVAVHAFACSGIAGGQPARQLFIAGTGPDELWDVTMRMEIVGMPMAMPAQTSQVCLKRTASPTMRFRGRTTAG